jgi:hypothetical protein
MALRPINDNQMNISNQINDDDEGEFQVVKKQRITLRSTKYIYTTTYGDVLGKLTQNIKAFVNVNILKPTALKPTALKKSNSI